jgi:hypothetical protein
VFAKLRKTALSCGVLLSTCCAAWIAHADAPGSRYELTAETAVDHSTGLTWQRKVAPTKYAWADAKAYCYGLGSGWRLPGLKELLTLVDPTRSNLAIDPEAFPDGAVSSWSASPFVGKSGGAWVVMFNYGQPVESPLDTMLDARCVR